MIHHKLEVPTLCSNIYDTLQINIAKTPSIPLVADITPQINISKALSNPVDLYSSWQININLEIDNSITDISQFNTKVLNHKRQSGNSLLNPCTMFEDRYTTYEEMKHYQNDSMVNMDNKNSVFKKEIDLPKKEFRWNDSRSHTCNNLKIRAHYVLNQCTLTHLKSQINDVKIEKKKKLMSFEKNSRENKNCSSQLKSWITSMPCFLPIKNWKVL